MNIAKLSKRIGAYLIDFLISLFIPFLGLYLALTFFPNYRALPLYLLILFFIAFNWLCYFLVNGVSLYLSNGRTLGYRIFGLRNIHRDMTRLSLKDAFTRSASQGLIVFGVVSIFYMLIKRSELSIFDRFNDTVIADWRNKSL